MTDNYKQSNMRFTAAIIALGTSAVIILTAALTNFYYAVILAVLLISVFPFIIKRMPVAAKKKLHENIFLLISGAAALLLMLFVIYFLTDIFLSAKSHLTLDFILKSPEQGLTEGGIFPAIMGTALLVILMSIVGVPFGVITALYLTLYTKESSKTARTIRFAINTLAGVPAIVFGLFGLGFFINTIGQTIDKIEFENKIKKVNEILSASNSPYARSKTATIADLDAYFKKIKGSNPEISAMLRDISEHKSNETELTKQVLTEEIRNSQKPVWGQPALIWAALTMALLTLPVVIVSVEESIRAVPKDMIEASLALGATKFTTIRKIIIPSSITGILTGTILAVSRGAGEVAPILFTGAAYYLPDLPSSLNSQFMELGYHIYILTTQSTNVEQTLPLQYATTFVLLVLTFALNFSAIFIRSKMRKKFGFNQ